MTDQPIDYVTPTLQERLGYVYSALRAGRCERQRLSDDLTREQARIEGWERERDALEAVVGPLPEDLPPWPTPIPRTRSCAHVASHDEGEGRSVQ